MSVGAVFAQYAPSPGISPVGSVASVGNTVTGSVTATYPDGTHVVLSSVYTTVMLRVCGTTGGCVLVQATFTPTATIGTYTFSFQHPSSVTGKVTVILPAGSLKDSFGNPLPAKDTIIGTYTT
jgi:hypothetical protein